MGVCSFGLGRCGFFDFSWCLMGVCIVLLRLGCRFLILAGTKWECIVLPWEDVGFRFKLVSYGILYSFAWV